MKKLQPNRSDLITEDTSINIAILLSYFMTPRGVNAVQKHSFLKIIVNGTWVGNGEN